MLKKSTRVASLDGWLSTDVNPGSEGAIFLDATKPSLFDSGTSRGTVGSDKT
jgi:hypothetical protein